jgi:spore maturation protein CgeB
MRILFIANKILPREGKNRIDSGYWNFYIPLLELGHSVYFYDTINPIERNFNKVVESFKPDLIFSIICGNKAVTPYEPLQEIKQITFKGNIKTFNWFCDDTWRFDNFSKEMCNYFTICSTPELSYINKYKEIGYNNILLGQWHVNESYVTNCYHKEFEIGFCGGLTNDRVKILQSLKSNITIFSGCCYETMFELYSSSKIGFNMTVNYNDPQKKRQMKQRLFEIPCAGSLMITENVNNLEEYFLPDKEIIVYDSLEEASDKIKFYLKNDQEREKIAYEGQKRYIREHTSKKRLTKIIQEIEKI